MSPPLWGEGYTDWLNSGRAPVALWEEADTNTKEAHRVELSHIETIEPGHQQENKKEYNGKKKKKKKPNAEQQKKTKK